jgi:hypothetical protein
VPWFLIGLRRFVDLLAKTMDRRDRVRQCRAAIMVGPGVEAYSERWMVSIR